MAGGMIEGGNRGVVSTGDAIAEEAFDMIGDGVKNGEDGSEVGSSRSRHSLFS